MKTQLTIDRMSNRLVARDEQGNVRAMRRTYCNPAALRQIVLDVEMLGAEIDWDGSQVEKPDEPAPRNADGEFFRVSFSAMWSDRLGAEILSRSMEEPYPVEFHAGSEDCEAFVAAVNQGIDAHLEAVFFEEFKGSHGRRGFRILPGSLPVLVRRLMEFDDRDELRETAESLASSICETLNIELI